MRRILTGLLVLAFSLTLTACKPEFNINITQPDSDESAVLDQAVKTPVETESTNNNNDAKTESTDKNNDSDTEQSEATTPGRPEKEPSASDVTTDSAQKNNTEDTSGISATKAKAIAFNHAKVTADKVYDLDVGTDRENGIRVYEVEFKFDKNEYDYVINAKTGEIIKSHKESDD